MALESKIARTVAHEIRVTVTPEENQRITASHPVNPRAYEAYLKVRFHLNKQTLTDAERAKQYFEEAVAADSSYALAYVRLAEVYGYYAFFMPPRETFPKLTFYARKALSIDGTIAEAYALIADEKFMHAWDWPAAEENFQRALELNANDPIARAYYGMFLGAMERVDEGIEQATRAKQLDPLSPFIINILAYIHFYDGEYDRSDELCREIQSYDSTFSTSYSLQGDILLENGNFKDAIALYRKAISLGDVCSYVGLGEALAKSGSKDEATMILARLIMMAAAGYQANVPIARIYAALGERDSVLYWLEKAYENRDSSLIYVKRMRSFDSFRSEPRYPEIIRKMGFEP